MLRKRIPEPAKGPVRLLRVARARRRLRRAASEASSIADWVELASDFACGPVTISPYQVASEISRLLDRLARRPPRTVLEIGTAKGGTLFLLTRVAARDALLVSVDLPGGPFGGGYDATRMLLYRSFAREEQRVELVRAASQEAATRDRVEKLLGGRRVDFLFIDGDHTLEGVSGDFRLYAGLVASGGSIAFHDIVPGEPQASGDVPGFWRDLKGRYGTGFEEIVESWEQGGAGIGVIDV